MSNFKIIYKDDNFSTLSSDWKQAPVSYTTVDALAVGDVALFDENKALIETAADAVNANSLYVGVAGEKMNVTMPDGTVAQKANIDFSNEIQKASKPSAVIGKHVKPVEEKIVITLTDATIIAGNRYVLRIVYKDFEVNNFQFTHTYEVYAETTTAKDLVDAFLKKINAHKNRRVQASASAAVLTLTAMPKDDNEGVYSLNEYSVVSMEASLYETIPGALLANQPKAVVGAKIERLQVILVRVIGSKYAMQKYVIWVIKVMYLLVHILKQNRSVRLLKVQNMTMLSLK